MEKCIICSTITSFKFEGEGEYNGKSMCPKCQSEIKGTRFGGCANEDDCSIKLERN
ncbi:MAG: hypothetical protein ACFFBP_19280 [Promethearchaeota archaeon]